MKSLLLFAFSHIVGVAFLLWLGWHFNDEIVEYTDRFSGIVTVTSLAFGTYSFVVSLLYQRNRRFHFFVNRLRLMVSRTHTYWQPSFDLLLSEDLPFDRRQLFNSVWEGLREGRFGIAKKIEQTPTTLRVELDGLMCFDFRLTDHRLHVHLDRKLLVPSHLYDGYRQKLARLAEEFQRITSPVEMKYGMTVSFGEGVPNPYFGFFVNQIPAELLQEFHVTFRPDMASTCRIEAEKDHVTIEGSSHVDLFEALSQVLSLNAVPGEVTT